MVILSAAVQSLLENIQVTEYVFVFQVRQLERTVGLKDLTVAEMEGRLREMSATTFDGVFIWRISDFAKKRQDAIAGRAPAMFSPGNTAHYHSADAKSSA